MNELDNEIQIIIKENRRKIGPIRKTTMTDEEIPSYLSAYLESINSLITKTDRLTQKSRGQKKELFEEYSAQFEDIATYLEDILGEYEDCHDRTALADNLEEVLEMLEDLSYLGDE